MWPTAWPAPFASRLEGASGTAHCDCFAQGDTVTAVAISHDGRVYTAASTNKQAVCYSAVDGTLLAKFTAEAGINAIKCLGRGSNITIAVGTFSGNLRFYSLLEGRELLAVRFESGSVVNCMACAVGDTRLCVGGQSGCIAVYQVDLHEADEEQDLAVDALVKGTYICVRQLLTFHALGPVLSLAMPESGQIIVAGGESKIVELWSLHEGPLAEVPPVRAGVWRSWRSSDRLSLVRSSNSSSKLNASSTAEESDLHERIEVRLRCMTTIHSVALTADGDTLAIGTSEETELYTVTHPDWCATLSRDR